MKEIVVEELSSPGCTHCKEFESFWHTIEKDFQNVRYVNTSITTPRGMELAGKYGIFASPGIIINEELFSTGGFSKDEFIKKLKSLSI